MTSSLISLYSQSAGIIRSDSCIISTILFRRKARDTAAATNIPPNTAFPSWDTEAIFSDKFAARAGLSGAIKPQQSLKI